VIISDCHTCGSHSRKYRHTCIAAQSTSAGAQRGRQTDTSVFSVWARRHRCCETLTGCSLWNTSISSWLWSFTDACIVWLYGTFILHPACHRFQPPPSPVVIILAASDPMHVCPLLAIVHFRWLEAASGTVCHPTSPQLEHWLFFGTASKLSLFPIISLLTVFGF